MESPIQDLGFSMKCRSCRDNKPIDKTDVSFIRCSNGRPLIKTKCIECGKRLNQIISEETYETMSKELGIECQNLSN